MDEAQLYDEVQRRIVRKIGAAAGASAVGAALVVPIIGIGVAAIAALAANRKARKAAADPVVSEFYDALPKLVEQGLVKKLEENDVAIYELGEPTSGISP